MLKKGQLLIDNLVGQQVILSPGQQLIAGRTADLPIGEDDLAVHRHFLHFFESDEVWLVKTSAIS